MDKMISCFEQIVWDKLVVMMANVVYVHTPSWQSIADSTGSHMDNNDEVPRAGGFEPDNLYDFYEAKDNQATTPFMLVDNSSSTSCSNSKSSSITLYV